MNIEIKRISNGWLIIIATPQGQSAIYKAEWSEVLTELGEIKIELPPTRN